MQAHTERRKQIYKIVIVVYIYTFKPDKHKNQGTVQMIKPGTRK